MFPYTYLIGWSAHNKWYYGVKYSKNSSPNDLWKTYFTSSKHVKEFRKQYGEPDVVQIRKIFTNKDSAIEWENKVLRRMNVIIEEKWLNKSTNKAICPKAASKGASKKKSLEMRQKLSIFRTGKNLSEETKKKIGMANKNNVGFWKGKNLYPSTIQKLSEHGKTLIGKKNPFYGKKHSEETKKRMSEIKKLKNLKNINNNKINKELCS